jgi:hypothetical protein
MKKGFIIIEIDGLSYQGTKGAIEKGRAPFLNKLVKNKESKLERIYCGLPALNLQAGLMHKEFVDVPGLTWYDKQNRRFRSLVNKKEAKRMEKKWQNGVFKKGVTIGSIFSGGAKDNFSVSNFDLASVLDNFSKLEIASYIFLSPFVLLVDLILSLFTRLHRVNFFSGFFIDCVLRKATFLLVRKEIEKGKPFIFVNFSGYDRRSHMFGKNSFLTRRVIRKIDKKIESIYNLLKESEGVDYDFFVMSDHGQIKSTSFEEHFGKRFDFFLEEKLGTKIGRGDQFQDQSFIDQIEESIVKIPWLDQMSKPFRNLMKAYLGDEKDFLDKKINFVPLANIGHIYFNNYNRKLFLEDINEKYPGFVYFLLNHESTKLLLVNSKEGTIVLGKEGRIIFDNSKEKIERKDPLNNVFDRDFVLNMLVNLTKMEFSGDLIVVNKKVKDRVISFSSNFSCHGGVSIKEQSAFLMTPFSSDSFEGNKDSRKLYNFFNMYLH